MSIIVDENKIDELLTRGVAEAIGIDSLREKLLSGKQLRIKLGIDPTSPYLHIGRGVTLLKLRDFQDLGHHIVLLVGNATGVIGDTSDKESERPMLTHDDVTTNMQEYLAQAGKILNMSSVEVVYNADWLNDLGYKEIGDHADAFSVHEFISRDNIKKRLDAGKRVSLREILYPLMQGYDSVAVEADVELGGTDQRFNLLAGRVLQEKFGQEAQDIIMMNLILGSDGRKMSSSWGNIIGLSEEASVIGEKIMNVPDDLIGMYLEHCTRVPMDEMESILAQEDPRERKIALAKALIALLHDEKIADETSVTLRAQFIDKDSAAVDYEKFPTKIGTALLDVLVTSGGANSKSDARRKIEQGGVSIGGEKITDVSYCIGDKDNEEVLKVGKKFFIKICL